MPAPVTLGLSPFELTVALPRAGSFVSTLVNPDTWDDGIGIELHFIQDDGTPPTVWAATVDGTNAAWNVAPDDVAELVATGTNTVELHYIDGDGTDLLWGAGRASVR